MLPTKEEGVTSDEAYSVFTVPQKKVIVALVAIASIFSPLSSTTYFPALPSISKQLNVSVELVNLTVTSYMVLQAVAPTFFGQLADRLGRRPIYLTLFIIYLGANVGLALQRAYPALLVLRMLQSSGCSGVIALGSGVVSDIAHPGERGFYMGIVNAGVMTGPALGPIIGGLIDQKLGWWWIFWFLAILAGIFLTSLILFFPETGRNVVGNGSIPPQGINASIIQMLSRRENEPYSPGEKPRFRITDINPWESIKLIFQKDMAIVLFMCGIFVSTSYTVLTSLPTLFQKVYHLNSLEVGLCYIPYGFGTAIAAFISGKIIDRDYQAVAKKCGIESNRRKGDDMSKFPIERARLRSNMWMVGVYAATLISYGWVLYTKAPLAVPIILLFTCGASGSAVFTVLATLTVDMFPTRPSSAMACNNLIRALMGAAGTAVVEIIISAMGVGWCFSLIGLLVLITCPLLWIERVYGMRWRLSRLESGDENRISS